MLSHLRSVALCSLFLGPAVSTPFVYHRRPQLQQYLGAGAIANPPVPADAYDYVVVGGGVTGLIAAARLAEASYTVAVIEMGDYTEKTTGNLTEVPGYTEQFDNSDTPPRDDVEWWWEVAGTPIGGSHDFSYFGYLQPSAGALQKWAEEVDDPSWTYANTKEYFDKAVFFTPANATTRFANATPDYPPDLGAGGPLEITYPRWAHPFSTWLPRAFDALDVSPIHGFVDGELLGRSWVLDTINSTDGTRATTWTAYLRDNPVLSRVHIFTNTLAQQILFDGTKATGVRVNASGESFTLTANHEVVLAGGGIMSPQLLMVSGVGPAKQLEAFDIDPVLVNEAVGQNMHDHIVFGVTYKVKVPTSSILLDETVKWQQEDLFKDNVTGMLTNPGPDYGATVKIPRDLRNFTQDVRDDLAALPSDWPELLIVSFPLGHDSPHDGNNYATLMGIPMTAKSMGYITLNSASMADKVNVIPNWLTSKTDLEVSVASLKYMRRVFEDADMVPILDGDEYAPGPEAATWAEVEDALKCHYRSMHHPAATLKMGRDDDPNAVVNSRGQVMGLENVRVVDPSAFPFLPPGLPLAPAFMFAEKITDNMINDQKSKGRHGKERTDL
ncbi:alcohol oxidase [Aspergillus sclerotiicarbonarius CBS 121057]|uniref:Alcohol oxidase n=1 Tax=Aspergillus sclerotiicarbonarius (strain CBS 121057 / IBT 28362) TaxID=1448318 RepID=A0A319FMR9_ASPSB|nr:alcohol oxidase [Aspergillus sclerotiicarbonarius CBS 121057]